jgi:hypothetical protein
MEERRRRSGNKGGIDPAPPQSEGDVMRVACIIKLIGGRID